MLVRYQRGISAYLSGLLTALTSLYLIEGNITLFKWDMGVINTTRIKNAIKHAKKYSYLGKVR